MDCQISFEMPFGTLNIISSEKSYILDVSQIFSENNYIRKFAEEVCNIYLMPQEFLIDSSYRANQMQKGIYLGHNIGGPCYLKILNNDIYLYCKIPEDYKKVIWNFVLKYIFTKISLDYNVLHMKGLVLSKYDNNKVILFGKGSSGKTTFGKELERFDYKIVSNTHCFVKDDYVWGVNTWIREREINGKECYTHSVFSQKLFEDGKILCSFIINFNKNEILEINNSDSYIRYYLKYFSCAINNYDLKEEVWDYFSSKNDKFLSMEYFIKEDKLLENFLARNKIKYLSLDCRNKKVMKEFLGMVL